MISNLPDDQEEEEKKVPPEDEEDNASIENEKEAENLPTHQFKQEFIRQPEVSNPDQYYLEVVRIGESPEWPRPKEELDVFSQPLEGGFIQYFAYPKDAGKGADDLPHAEEIAAKNKSDNAVIIIDQISDHLTPGSCLELILAKGGHALAKTDSNLDNLEANITSLLDLGRQTLGIKVEHFMSTSNVSPEVEKRLDDLEEAETEGEDSYPVKEYNREQRDTKMEENNPPLYFNDRSAVTTQSKHSKVVTLIPILIIIVIFAAVVYFRGSLLTTLKNQINPPKPVVVETTPTPTPSPTMTPVTVDRSKFKVRVLNGTSKTGAAGVLADQLKEKGWQIDRTGNATSSAIPESFVRGKPGMGDAISVLIADVGDYQGSSSSSSLKSSDKADLEFVIGKK